MNLSREKTIKKPSFIFKTKELKLENNEEFPSLIQKTLHKNQEKNDSMNYINASLTKNEIVVEETLEPGWIQLHPGNIHTLKKNGLERTEDDELTTKEFKKKANIVFSKMVKRWETYKRRNREFYGDMYKNDFSDDELVNSEDNESSSSEDENENDYLSE